MDSHIDDTYFRLRLEWSYRRIGSQINYTFEINIQNADGSGDVTSFGDINNIYTNYTVTDVRYNTRYRISVFSISVFSSNRIGRSIPIVSIVRYGELINDIALLHIFCYMH